MKHNRSRTRVIFGVASLALIAAAIFYSKPAPAEPAVTVYRNPT